MSKKNCNKGFTSQGIRDLNSIPSKPRGIRLDLPPDMQAEDCSHPDESLITLNGGRVKCVKCSTVVN